MDHVRQSFALLIGVSSAKTTSQGCPEAVNNICRKISAGNWSFVPKFDPSTKKWSWADVAQGSVDVSQSCELTEVVAACDRAHRLLDELPATNTFLLDVICLIDKAFEEFPVSLYGLITRASDWHGAKVTVVCMNETFVPADDLDIDVVGVRDFCLPLTEDAVWRGSVSFFDDQSKHFYDLPNFELLADGKASVDLLESHMSSNVRMLTSAGSRLSSCSLDRKIQVVSRCTLSKIPPFYVTESRFKFRSVYSRRCAEDASTTATFFQMANSETGLILRLDFIPGKSSSSFMEGPRSNLTTENWKKWVLNGMKDEDCPLTDVLKNSKSFDSLFFFLFDPKNSSLEKSCILLNPSAKSITRNFDLIYDVGFREKSSNIFFDYNLNLVKFNFDFGEFQRFVAAAREQVLEHLKDFDVSKEELHRIVVEHCVTMMAHQGDVTSEKFSFPKNVGQASDDDGVTVDESGWEGRRFLSLLEHLTRQRNVSDELKSVEDYVVLEAKELVKLFDDKGNPRPGSVLQPLPFNSKGQVYSEVDKKFLASPSSWPELLWTNYHDLFYNRDETSESRDREMARVQQSYVGLRETTSTCNSLNTVRETEVITKTVTAKTSASNSNGPTSVTSATSGEVLAPKSRQVKSGPRYPASVLRKSPRKLTQEQRLKMAPPGRNGDSSKRQDEIFKQKLRHAVYTALDERGINEKSAIFRPCFKKLFDICKMYATDMPKKIRNEGGVKKWLTTVAQQNVESVVSLEQKLRE